MIPLGVGLASAIDRDASREPLVLFVGSIFNRRHLPALVDGFALLARRRPDVRLEIVGANRTHPLVDLRALAAAAAPGRIRMRDWVDDDELRSLYERASVFAFLSEYEGFGLTPLEALAAGIPPVVLDTAVAREVLADAALYVAAPERPPGRRRAERRAWPRAPNECGCCARRPAVLARYDWRRTAAATLAVLEEAARS